MKYNLYLLTEIQEKKIIFWLLVTLIEVGMSWGPQFICGHKIITFENGIQIYYYNFICTNMIAGKIYIKRFNKYIYVNEDTHIIFYIES